MPVAKKESANHKCWWQTKIGVPNQSADTKWKKQNSWNRLKTPKRLPTCKQKVEKTPKTNKQTKNTKSQQSNRLLSAAKEWTTTVIRA